MKLRVEVTAQDIAAGRPLNPYSCPIACALKRMGYQHVRVHPFTGVGGLGSYEWVPLPDEANTFAQRFDRDLGFVAAPFSFDLDLPDEVTP